MDSRDSTRVRNPPKPAPSSLPPRNTRRLVRTPKGTPRGREIYTKRDQRRRGCARTADVLIGRDPRGCAARRRRRRWRSIICFLLLFLFRARVCDTQRSRWGRTALCKSFVPRARPSTTSTRAVRCRRCGPTDCPSRVRARAKRNKIIIIKSRTRRV